MKTRRTLGVTLSLVALALCILASVAFGAKTVGIKSVLAAFGLGDGPSFDVSVVQARFPRTILGIIAGAALAVSGGLMQSLTRNPIADPSILGVNTGASLFVVVGIAFFHIGLKWQYIGLALAGTAITAIFVYGLASMGSGGATPIKLAIAGAATSIALLSLVNAIMLPNSNILDQFRFWQTGSIGGATWQDIGYFLPSLAAGFIIAVCIAPSLNALALGDDVATGLGTNVVLVRGLAALAGVILCGTTTALAGPIAFVGLMIPHFMRLLMGPDMKWIIPMSAIGGACLLLVSDVIGRVLGGNGEINVGIVTAVIGAPVFVFIVRRVKVKSL